MNYRRPLLLGLSDEITNIDKHSFEALFKAAGLNTGNLLFVSGIKQALQADHIEMGYPENPRQIKERCDCIIIPAANWLQPSITLGDLADFIERADLPCIVVGLGAQAPDQGAIPKLPDGTIRFLHAASRRSNSISVRGPYTAEVMREHGFNNSIVTGCPSLLRTRDRFTERPTRRHGAFGIEKIAIHSTRYELVPRVDEDIHTNLFRFAYRNKMHLILQSERPELYFALKREREIPGLDDYSQPYDYSKNLAEIYGDSTVENIRKYLREKSHAFFSVPQWTNFIQQFHFIIGTRIHGAIAGLMAGIPSCLITHDSRTEELADILCIPAIKSSDIEFPSSRTLMEIYENLDTRFFYDSLAGYEHTFHAFFKSNKLSVRIN